MLFVISLMINILRWMLITIRLFEIKKQSEVEGYEKFSKLNKLTMSVVIAYLTTLIPSSVMIWCTNRQDTSAREKEALSAFFGVSYFIACGIILIVTAGLAFKLR